MRTFVFIFSFLFASVSAFGQTVSMKKDVVLVDDQPVFVFKKINALMYSVESLKGERLAVLQVVRFNNGVTTHTSNSSRPVPGRNTSTTTSNTTSYYDVTFMDDQLTKCEIPMQTKKAVAKEWVHFNLIQQNFLNREEVQKYVKIYGTKFSEYYSTNGKPATVIVRP